MPGFFLIDEAKRKKFALWGIVVNLMFLHVWASIMMAKLLFSEKLDKNTAETMQAWFSSIMTAISISLFVLISDKFIDFVITKFAGAAPAQPQEIVETRTVTVTPAAPVTPPASENVNDVNMNVQGNVNVQQPKD